MHFQNIHTFTYQKTFFLQSVPIFKFVESLKCILERGYMINDNENQAENKK